MTFPSATVNLPDSVLSRDAADRLAAIPLSHVTREYPHHLTHLMMGPESEVSPRRLHPLFFGSFDWHSCVHGWWTLFTLYRLRPDMAGAEAIRTLADAHFTPEAVQGEVAYFTDPAHAGFERPYGWAWLLMLAAELYRHGTPEGRAWADALRPLADAVSTAFKTFLPKAIYPVRAGAHTNTAFALRLGLEFEDRDLRLLCREKARDWYGLDRACPRLEPSQDDFLSPCLVVAELMRHVLPRPAFSAWLSGYFGGDDLADVLAPVLSPPEVSDRTDGKIAHLDGLCLSRAWCLNALSIALNPEDRRAPILRQAGERHLAAGAPHSVGDYAGEHWLASFVVLALTEGYR